MRTCSRCFRSGLLTQAQQPWTPPPPPSSIPGVPVGGTFAGHASTSASASTTAWASGSSSSSSTVRHTWNDIGNRRTYSSAAAVAEPPSAATTETDKPKSKTKAAAAAAESPIASEDPFLISPERQSLVKQLLSLIYSPGKKPDRDSAWNAYVQLLRYDYDNGVRPHAIPAHYHQMTLRAIAPSRATFVDKQRFRRYRVREAADADASFKNATDEETQEDEEAAYSLRSYRPHKAPTGEGLPLRDDFHRRAFLILDRMALHGNAAQRDATGASSSQEAAQFMSPLPDIKDYHFLLKSAVETKDWHMFTSISDRMVDKGLLFRDGNSRSASALPIATPIAETYQLLLSGYLGLITAEKTDAINRQFDEASAGGKKGDKLPHRHIWDAFEHKKHDVGAIAMSLFRDMIRAYHISPTPHILQTLCVVLKMCGHFPQVEMVLQQGYGITIQGLKANPEWVSDHQHPFPITTRILNTILQILGETGTPREMIAVFEALRNPLPTPKQPAAPGSPFKTDFKNLFRSDSAMEHFTQNNRPPGVRARPKNTKARPDPNSLPNTETFYILLSHCFARPRPWSTDGFDVPQFLINTHIDADLMQQSAQQRLCRKGGWYRWLGGYVQSLALDFYEEQLQRVASQLGYTLKKEVDPDTPTVENIRDEVMARFQEDVAEQQQQRQGQEPEQPPLVSNRHFISSDPRLLHFPGIFTEEGRIGYSLLPPRMRLAFDPTASTLSHQPFFDPPTITPCEILFTSMFSQNIGYLSAMFFEAMTQLRRGLHLLQIELDLMETAQRDVAQRIAEHQGDLTEKTARVTGSSIPQSAPNEQATATTATDEASSPLDQADTTTSPSSSSSSSSSIKPRTLRTLEELHRRLTSQITWVKSKQEELQDYEENFVFPRGDRIRKRMIRGIYKSEKAQMDEEQKEMFMREEEENRARILAELKQRGENRIPPAQRRFRGRGVEEKWTAEDEDKDADANEDGSMRYPL